MRIRFGAQDVTDLQTGLVAVPLLDGAAPNPAYERIDAALDGALSRAVREEGFGRRDGATLLVRTLGRLTPERVLVVGLGRSSTTDIPPARRFAHFAGKVARDRRVRRLALAWDGTVGPLTPSDAEELVLGAVLSGYRFDHYKTDQKDGDRSVTLDDLRLLHAPRKKGQSTRAALQAAAERGRIRAEAVSFARDLVNEPANSMGPAELAARAGELVGEGLSVRVLDRAAIEKERMGLLLAVTAGSASDPTFIHAHYRPSKAAKDIPSVALVGKGVTFDAGGLCLKPPQHIADMKSDMAGAAAVLAVMEALPRLAPQVEVHGLIPAVENLVSASAYRPGDVVRGRSGKTVEAVNTDAEGRLILADALSYALELDVDAIIDVATLTGACVVALGEHTAGLFANRRKVANDILRASREAGESFWELPLDNRLQRELRSPVADVKNVGSRWGGAIHGGLFLREFVDDHPWAHLDIAGPAFADRPAGLQPKGATGFGVLTLLRYVERLAR